MASDGKTRKMVAEDVQPGHVVRRPYADGVVPPFEDTLILGPPVGPDNIVKLARPYVALVDGLPKMGLDQYEAPLKSLLEYYVIVLLNSGKPTVWIHNS